MTHVRHTAFIAAVLAAGTSLAADPGGPLPGLTAEERAQFESGKALFEHSFTRAEGVGPLFNETSCVTCHAGPATGGFDPLGTTNNVTHFTLTTEAGAIYQAFEFGGPVVEKRSVVQLDPNDPCQLPPDSVPTSVHGIGTSSRHTPQVFGFGLLDAVPDSEILEYQGKQPWKKRGVIGVANWGVELEGLARLFAFHLDGTRTQPTGAPRVGRFGWKAPVATLFQFSTEPFNIELGVSTPFFPRENHPFGDQLPAQCRLPNQPNDTLSQKSLQLYYFQAFLAPPAPLPRTAEAARGEAIFNGIGCADCHRKRLHTAQDCSRRGPTGPRTGSRRSATGRSSRTRTCSSTTWARRWPTFARRGAQGGLWRTTPLWGIRHKTNYLHDGSATSVDEAIDRHGGESTVSARLYEGLSDADEQALLKFLDSL